MTIATGDISQTAWVVADVEATERFFTPRGVRTPTSTRRPNGSPRRTTDRGEPSTSRWAKRSTRGSPSAACVRPSTARWSTPEAPWSPGSTRRERVP